MKNFRLLATFLVVALCVMGTSCSNDDDKKDNGDLSKSIVGTWKVTAWESNEGAEGEMLGAQFTFKENGSGVCFNEPMKWHVLKKGATYDGVTLKYDAIVIDDDWVLLVKERTSDTMSLSILEFEMQNDAKVYSRGTLKKIK